MNCNKLLIRGLTTCYDY